MGSARPPLVPPPAPPLTRTSAPSIVPPTRVVAERIVDALTLAGMVDAADLARSVAGLPPRVLTDDERFVAGVRDLVTSSQFVGFHADNVDLRDRYVALVEAMTTPGGKRYRVRVDAGCATRLEVAL